MVWKYLNERTGAVTLSLISNSLLILLKIAVGLYTGSVSILSEAIHSGTDLLAALIAFFAIRQAARPADWNHPYGHGKAESLSAAVEALLIFVAAGLIIFEASQRLIHGATIENVESGIVVMFFASGVNFVVSRHLFNVARRTESPALAADARHLSTDLLTALGVALGLVLVRITGVRALDPLIAIGVALFIVRAAWNITRGSMADLLDESLPHKEENIIRGILDSHRSEYSRVRTMRTRRSGSHRHVYIALEFPPGVSLAQAHQLTAHLEEDIRRSFPDISAVIEAEPSPEPGNTPLSLVASIERLAGVNNLAVQRFNVSAEQGKWEVVLDLEGREDLTGEEANRLAARIEDELRRENPQLGRVDVRVEPALASVPQREDEPEIHRR